MTQPAPPPSSQVSAVELRNLHYRFPDGTHALRGVDLSIAPGESVGLIGPNGAGKSTLLLHLNGLLPDDHEKSSTGEVLIFGQSLRHASAAILRETRRDVGLVFQDPNDQLFCPTVFEDVAFGPQQLGLSAREVQARVEHALSLMKLEGFENRMPHHLSGGEKRRVCLAGVLACQPRILVLDEPTSNLDPKGKRELKSLLANLPLTKIIATHDLELVVELCPRTILLSNGQVIAAGPTSEMLSNETLMLEHDLEKPHILFHPHPHLPILAPGPFLAHPSSETPPNAIVHGNARLDGRFHNGWFFGHFMKADPARQSVDVEYKWGAHAKGDSQSSFTANKTAQSFSILISGRFRLIFKTGATTEEFLLQTPGDYALWPSGVAHAWCAEEDSVVLTVRRPSLPDDQYTIV